MDEWWGLVRASPTSWKVRKMMRRGGENDRTSSSGVSRRPVVTAAKFKTRSDVTLRGARVILRCFSPLCAKSRFSQLAAGAAADLQLDPHLRGNREAKLSR